MKYLCFMFIIIICILEIIKNRLFFQSYIWMNATPIFKNYVFLIVGILFNKFSPRIQIFSKNEKHHKISVCIDQFFLGWTTSMERFELLVSNHRRIKLDYFINSKEVFLIKGFMINLKLIAIIKVYFEQLIFIIILSKDHKIQWIRDPCLQDVKVWFFIYLFDSNAMNIVLVKCRNNKERVFL